MAVCQPLEAAALDALAAPETVAELERLGVLRVDVRGRRRTASLAHPLYVQAVRHRTPSLRTERILRTHIARVRGLGARRQEDALRLAGWELALGTAGDPELLLRAARLACAVHDYPTTERLAAAALAAPGGADHAAMALFLLGHARSELHRPEEGCAAHEAAAAAVVLPAQAQLLCRIAVEHALTLGYTVRRPEEALAVIERAIAATPGLDHAELTAAAAALLNDRGRTGRAVALLADVPVALARTSPVAGTARLDVLGATGRPVQALTELAAGGLDGIGRIGAEGTSILSHRSYLRFSVATVMMAAGRLADAQAEAEGGMADVVLADVPGVHARGALLLGRLHLLGGRDRTALRHFRELAGVARASARPELLRDGLAGASWCRPGWARSPTPAAGSTS
ncbi:hypothetical protein BJF78_11690 [Pseudonocardia sp. CNS-139]|nr:hypothetical protein BJF78_11690 [Pseudonocardia sp. CNS-139]